MRFTISTAAILAVCFVTRTYAVAFYDEYRDADDQQSSYLPNHNMDPSVVNSASFGLIWHEGFNPLEYFYAKPLTYTPSAGGDQLLFLASNQNWIRTLNAKTGALINARQVHTPFLQSDIVCGDIPNFIGITGTPVIDPATDLVHFFSKTYIPNFRIPGNTGLQNGVYYLHSVNINTLEDAPGSPVLIDGSIADNDPRKHFIGGVILQRPSLTQIGNVIYGSFGGHCDLFNYTGVVIGVDIQQHKVVTQWAVESGPLAAVVTDMTQAKGGSEGGIWMSGSGIATDGERLFVVSGNGDGHENNGAPAAASSGCRTLGEAAINLAVDKSTGVVTLSDYFQPYDYQNMDAGDQDFGSGSLVLLDPTVFSGTGVDKMAVTAGKNGKIYIMNANNLGGYKLGTGQTDNVLQTITTNAAVFGAAGSYPGEGGFVYVTPVGYPTYAYGLGHTQAGIPQFSKVGQTNEASTGRVGTGVPTITSLNGKPGTAILWMTDPDAGLRAWYAVPQDGVLVNIPLPQIPGVSKFQRPVFGDGRVYTTDPNGNVYCLGSPVNLPLNCSSLVDFGQVALETKATQIVNCTAAIAITKINGLVIPSPQFTASNSSLPSGSLAQGQSFSFPVTWDLTNVTVSNTNGSYGNVSPGVKSSPLTFFTTNGKTGYATEFPISLTGTEVSQKPFLSVTPTTVDYGGIVVTQNSSNIETVTSPINIANEGLSSLTILGYAYTTDPLDGDAVNWTNSTLINGAWDLGYGFTAASLPPVGSQLGPNSAISVSSTFNPINGTGHYSVYWQVWSDGGTNNIILVGSAATVPIAELSVGTNEGGWLPPPNILMDFGIVTPGSSHSLQLRLCNKGGSALIVDKSKPPTGVFRISDPAELDETLQIPPAQCAYATVLMVANTEEYNLPNLVVNNTWTFNTNDDTWGVHVVEITGTVVSTKVGPKNSTGQYVYQYLGCFAEDTTGPRLFPNEPLSPSPTNDNTNCMTACYAAGQYGFAGTQFGDECWCGNTPPPLVSQDLTDNNCNYACPGDPLDSCGATGWLSVYHDPTKYVKGTDPSLYEPQTVKSVGNYVSQGCYSEGNGVRALGGKSPQAPPTGFTIETCEAACVGYTYFGMEYANQCYCGNSIGSGAVNQSSSSPATNGCNMVCAGNALEYCGGGNRLNLYALNGTSGSSATTTSASGSATSITTPPTPTSTITVPFLTNWTLLGCYSEGSTSRALTGLEDPIPLSTNSVENCGKACVGFQYFGVEYSDECYCGNTISAGSVNQSSSDPNVNGCNMVCAGNAGEYCGGPNRLNMYSAVVGSAKLTSVSSSSSTSKPASSSSTISSSSSAITTSSSSSLTSSSSSSSVSSTSTSSSSSSSVSSTSSSQSSSSSLSSILTISGSTSTITATLHTLIPTTTPSPTLPWAGTPTPGTTIGTWQYLDCYNETTGRALSGTSTSNSNMTIENCQAFCTTNNFALAGVEYASQCFCGNNINAGATSGQTGCTKTCTGGGGGEICGGNSRLNIFNNTAYVYPSTPATVAGYNSQGCYQELSKGRLLSIASYTNKTCMTVESCVGFCNAKGYAVAGVEYSQECYCAATVPSTATQLSGGSCNMLCKGNNKEFCGGSGALGVYVSGGGGIGARKEKVRKWVG